MYDLIGIGALNLDYVATRRRLLTLDPQLTGELASHFELGNEKPVSEEEINQTLLQMGATVFKTFLGGSSFNAVHTMATTYPGLSLGYVGVAGQTGIGGLDFQDALATLRIDTNFVEGRPELRSGVCISYIDEGERSLLTFPGANVEMAKYLGDNYSSILGYVCDARILHVTSFFDSSTPKVLADLLADAKKGNPFLKISFDPGHHWVEGRSDAVCRILKLTDYLFLNAQEFNLLGHYRPGTSDFSVARNIFELCGAATLLIILKRYDSIRLFHRLRGRMLSPRYSNIVLSADSIEDATGAGDVFAGGFLLSTLVPGLETRHGVELGLRLVRSKLLTAGSIGFHAFSSIFSSLIGEISEDVDLHRVSRSNSGGKIFIGHGRSPVWSQVLAHIKEDLQLSAEAFESESRVGKNIINFLEEMLGQCAFAIFVMTAEDETADGLRRARQNVLHEVGLFQGRLGFQRVVLLIEDGVEKFSNIDGLQYISFSGSRIEKAFFELDRTLRREHII